MVLCRKRLVLSFGCVGGVVNISSEYTVCRLIKVLRCIRERLKEIRENCGCDFHISETIVLQNVIFDYAIVSIETY